MPVLNWWQFNESGELSCLCKKQGLIPLTETDNKVRQMRHDFINAFGLTRDACLYFEKTIQLEIEKNKTIIVPKEADEMLIEVLEHELRDLIPKRENFNTLEFKKIEKYMGVKVDKDLSVWDYYDYKKFIEADAKQDKQARE